MTEQERFEAWFNSRLNSPMLLERTERGYVDIAADRMWQGWQAALESRVSEQDRIDAFDVALNALHDYQSNWDTGLPAEYAQSERIQMECAVEAVREALNQAKGASK